MSKVAYSRKTIIYNSELKDRIESKAKDEGRTFNSMVRYMCKFYLEVTTKGKPKE